MTKTIESQAQLADPGALIELYSLDVTPYGGPIEYFTPMVTEAQAPVVFDGITYSPVPVQAEGFEKNGKGALPRPKFSLSNINLGAGALLLEYKDLVGCTVKRITTLDTFLDAVNFEDGNPDADPGQYWGPDIFRVERKTAQTHFAVEWELSAAIDQEARKLPGGQVLRNGCRFDYRRPDGAGGFIYPTSTRACPYSGASCFDRKNLPTTAASDFCSHELNGCLARYGKISQLPFGAFPGAGMNK